MVRIADLFAGCGGLSLGFQNAGYELVAAFENWYVAAECYENNFDHPVFRTDLSDVETAVSQILKLQPDMIVGGPPCQDFSHAGKRIEADRASLTVSFAKIIAAIRPKIFLMENVDRAQNSGAYALAKEIYKEAGYGLTERVLMASLCGVPQRRKRFFCIGVLEEKDGAINAYLTKNLSKKEMTVRDYLGDSLDTEYYYRHPRNYNRRGIFSIDEPAPTMRGVNRPIPKGYPGHPSDACPLSDKVRPLTTLERSLIQTFPADFKWCGSKTDREQMVGNAVPVNLATYVANALSEYIIENEICFYQNYGAGFINWLQTKKGLSPRSASDARSRLLRARKLLPFADMSQPNVYLAQLGEIPQFNEMTPSVRSQLRASVRLFCEYSQNICR